ncbi:ADP-ribosylation factor-like protein 16 [Parasteatoda tepidariorum]|uniref:ADP-ribosylation factor-like protein 16 n=1 Tax=Parasteatoda tepidariorum TaxID=114398 RepID=UPI00077F84E7|nr:ADP-ribosylation factor-like protein 16 [Parasteatoda tepidariorum]XP_015906646.1 ADP-ribosylation factor-like protein 16 [Parasteatoda tepidariorum]
MIICIGPKNVGKTLLLRRLQQKDIYCNMFDEVFSTVPTVGVNIAQIVFEKLRRLQISELGGTMAAIWPMHYNGCKGVLFLVDSSNLQQISCATILLLEALKHPSLQNARFLIILNKTDITVSTTISEMKYLLRLDDICLHAKQNIEVIESSCLTGKGLKDIKQWLQEF